jgi:PASTA domain
VTANYVWRTSTACALLGVLLAGCAPNHHGGTPFGATPESGPASLASGLSSAAAQADPCLAPVAAHVSGARIVPAGASSARICRPGGVPEKLDGNRPVVIGRLGAGILAEILDAAPAGAAACTSKPDALLRFNYADGTTSDVEVAYLGCDPPTASAGGQIRTLDSGVGKYLETAAVSGGLMGNPAPDLTGLSLTEATDVARGAGLSVAVGGRTTDTLVAPDTVVLQYPPGGTGMIGNTVDLLLSQQPEPACTVSQLEIDYRGLSYSATQNFATLDVRDTSSQSCTLSGPIEVVGRNAAGHQDTNVQTFAVTAGLVLTAHTAKIDPSGAVPGGASIAGVQLQANVRDGPDANGSCARHLVIPATWAVSLAGGTKLVRNGDATQRAFSACLGQLSGPTPQLPVTTIN